MKRDEYFLKALLAEAYKHAKWVFSVFTIVKDNEYQDATKAEFDYQLFTYKGKYITWTGNEWANIEDVDTSKPLYLVEEGITIPSQEMLLQPTSLPFPLLTRVGTLFINYYCLASAFKKKVEYQQGHLKISNLEKMIVKRLKNRPEDPKDENEQDIYPDEVKAFSSACSSTAGFSGIANPSATRYTMQPAPGIKEKRKELIAKYHDKLNDPAVVAMIEKELIAYDKAHQMQDPEGGFYQSDKAFNVSRKKLFVMGGIEMSEISTGDPVFVENSLSESWDVNSLPAMINSLRNGSYNRGALTALGGEAVKFIFRIFAATSITEEDCGSRLGIPRNLTPETGKTYIGNTAILPNGNQIVIDEKNLPTLYGKDIMIRSPGFCRTGGANFCMKCLGEQLRGSENALAALASRVGSQMLDIFMAKMHGVALQTTPWKPEKTLY